MKRKPEDVLFSASANYDIPAKDWPQWALKETLDAAFQMHFERDKYRRALGVARGALRRIKRHGEVIADGYTGSRLTAWWAMRRITRILAALSKK